MPERSKGGQPGNENALKHGRYSLKKRAERRAVMVARLAEDARKHVEWVKTLPKTDYAAICAAIEGTRATKH